MKYLSKSKHFVALTLLMIILSGCNSNNFTVEDNMPVPLNSEDNRFEFLSPEPVIAGRIICDKETGVQYVRAGRIQALSGQETGYLGVLVDQNNKPLLKTSDTPTKSRFELLLEDVKAGTVLEGYIVYDTYTLVEYFFRNGYMTPILDKNGKPKLYKPD